MKRAIRLAVLMFGIVGTYAATAVPQVPAPDGNPLCVPDRPCPYNKGNLPPAMVR